MTKNAVLDKNYVDFDVIAENWSTYELEDKTILRSKTVLLNIIKRDAAEKKDKALLGIQLLNVIDSATKGSLGKKWTVEELEKYVTEPNMMFRQIKDGGPSVYETKNSKIVVRAVVKQIKKTSEFDLNGDPAYIITSDNEIILMKKGTQNSKTESAQAKC